MPPLSRCVARLADKTGHGSASFVVANVHACVRSHASQSRWPHYTSALQLNERKLQLRGAYSPDSRHVLNRGHSTFLRCISSVSEDAAPVDYANLQQRLTLLDAMPFIYRVHHGFGTSTRLMSDGGQDTTVMYGLLKILFFLLSHAPPPTHLVVVFDAPGKTFRHELYGGYKGQREETPQEIRGALQPMKQLIRAMGIPIMQVSGVEADDVIGTMALRALGEGMEVDIATADKDFFQLLRPGLRLLLPPKLYSKGSPPSPHLLREYTQTTFESSYPGLTPSQWVDYLALTGDASDNVPGVKGIGEKSALQLLREYGTLDRVLENASQLLGRKKHLLSSQEGIASATLSKKLVRIMTHLTLPPLCIDLDDLRVRRPSDDGHLARTILQELQFKKPLHQLDDIWNQANYEWTE